MNEPGVKELVIPDAIWPSLVEFFDKRNCDLVQVPLVDEHTGEPCPFWVISPRTLK